MNYTKSQLESLLSNGSWKVTFRKISTDEIRVMNCTRDFDKISEFSSNWVPPKGKEKTSPNQVVVWDLDKNYWRSFNINTIISVTQNPENVNEVNLDPNKINPLLIKDKLSNGSWALRYWTLSGIVKDTIGTRDQKLIPSGGMINNPSRRVPEHQIIYFDELANDWRSFRSFALISITKVGNGLVNYVNTKIGIPKDKLEDMLKTGIYKIVFIKRDDSIRTMICTADPKYMNNYTGTLYPHLISVYDLEKEDFRNIRYSSILSIEKVK